MAIVQRYIAGAMIRVLITPVFDGILGLYEHVFS